MNRVSERLGDLVEGDDPDDIAFVERLVASFLDRAPVLLDDLERAITAGDGDLAAHHAHALKGASSNVGADDVAGLCTQAQRRAEDLDFETLAGYPARIAAALDTVREELARAVGELNR